MLFTGGQPFIEAKGRHERTVKDLLRGRNLVIVGIPLDSCHFWLGRISAISAEGLISTKAFLPLPPLRFQPAKFLRYRSPSCPGTAAVEEIAREPAVTGRYERACQGDKHHCESWNLRTSRNCLTRPHAGSGKASYIQCQAVLLSSRCFGPASEFWYWCTTDQHVRLLSLMLRLSS